MTPTLRSFAFLAALVAAVAMPTAAQDEPGCLQASPCEMDVDVTVNGIEEGQTTFTSGDWVILSVYNDDDKPHTVSLSGHDVTLVVPSYDIAESEPFTMRSPGTYKLNDAPSGDSVDVTVEGVETFPGSTSDSEKGSPGLAPTMVLAALAATAIILRRRQ